MRYSSYKRIPMEYQTLHKEFVTGLFTMSVHLINPKYCFLIEVVGM